MEIMTTIKDWMAQLGDLVSKGTQKLIEWIASLGLNLNPIATKIISLVIICVLLYLSFTALSKLRPAIKWFIIILLVLLAISVFISFGGTA
jgi:ABC-type xylose transport system permease subunit